MTISSDSEWAFPILLGIAGVVLIGLGIMLGLFYCEYRRGNDLQVTYAALAIGQRCTETLANVVPGAFVIAQQGGYRPMAAVRVSVPSAIRDSAREARWTHQP